MTAQNADKYKIHGDLNWQIYATNSKFVQFVNMIVSPFKGVDLGSLVNIGCGDGLVLSFLDDLGFKCFGVDESTAGIDAACAHNVTAEFFIETPQKFQSRFIAFDYLFCLDLLDTMEDPEVMVDLMRRVQNFGVIVSKKFTPNNFDSLFSRLKGFGFDSQPMMYEGYFAYKVYKK